MEVTDPRDLFAAQAVAEQFPGRVHGRAVVRIDRQPACYILTSAQNNTPVHTRLWDNLLAYAEHKRADIFVARFAYNTNAFAAREAKPGASPNERYAFAPEIQPFVRDDRVALTPSLHWCGEVNILPTADRPLTGFENYTGRASGIYPHAKQVMESIATPPGTSGVKLNYTTGTVTLRNYIQRKAGLKAEPFHAYGALIVEVDSGGRWFVRQLRATEDGSFQDLDVVVHDGLVHAGQPVHAIQWGDTHVAQLDPVVRKTNWGQGGILDTLRPRYQFQHDVLDFEAQNHHDVKNPHAVFAKHVRGRTSVERELEELAAFLSAEQHRDWCQSVVVGSNHDAALLRWLREADFRNDPANAQTYLKLQYVVYCAMAAQAEDFHLLRSVMRGMGVPEAVRFLQDDDSFVICRVAGGVECGLHGHAGVNGSRGSPRQFAKLGRRVNTGHTHSASIIGDCFTAGTSSILRPSYARGPSSWTHSHIVTYDNGCRTIITLRDGFWRADY